MGLTMSADVSTSISLHSSSCEWSIRGKLARTLASDEVSNTYFYCTALKMFLMSRLMDLHNWSVLLAIETFFFSFIIAPVILSPNAEPYFQIITFLTPRWLSINRVITTLSNIFPWEFDSSYGLPGLRIKAKTEVIHFLEEIPHLPFGGIVGLLLWSHTQ